MADSAGITADGMGFAYRSSNAGVTPKVWTELGEAFSITPPNPTKGSADFTHLKSPNNTKEYKPTRIEPGESNVVMNYVKTSRTLLDTLFASQAIQEFQITYPDASTETFSGFLTGRATEGAEVEGKLTLNVPIKITGLPVFVAGT